MHQNNTAFGSNLNSVISMGCNFSLGPDISSSVDGFENLC